MNPDPHYWAGRRVCVTGGTGFLGFQIAWQLLALGARVRVLALEPAGPHPLLDEPRVQCFFGDVRDGAIVRRATADCQTIFHTAGVVADWGPGLQKMHSVHVDGTRRVLESAAAGACVVHTSSVVTVGASRRPTALTEESPFNLEHLPVDYVHAKRAAERAALEAAARGSHLVVANPGYLVGPDDHERSVMGRFCVRFWKGRVPLAPAGGFNLVDVRDVAAGHLLAAEHGRPGRRYILGGENCTLRRFMELLAEVADMRPRGLPALPRWAMNALAAVSELRAWATHKPPYPSFQQAHLNRYYWYYNSDRAARELGYHARPLKETLLDAHHWHAGRGEATCRGLNRWWMRAA